MGRHVRKGDLVVVTSGDSRGEQGKILRVIPKRDQVIVQGINVRTKHLKASQSNPQGGIIHKEMPIHISNVSPVSGRNAIPAARTMRPQGFGTGRGMRSIR